MPTCKNCGAQIPGEARFCSFCGAELPRPAEQHVYVHYVREENQRGTFDVARRLAEVRRSPQFQQLMVYKPSTAGHAVAGGCMSGCGALFAVAALGMMIPALGVGVFGIFPLALLIFVFVGLGVCVWGIAGLAGAVSGDIVRVPALVLGESTSMSHSRGHDGEMQTQTSHQLALAFEDGTEGCFSTNETTLAMVDRGDAGVAYFLGRTLLEFRVVTRA